MEGEASQPLGAAAQPGMIEEALAVQVAGGTQRLMPGIVQLLADQDGLHEPQSLDASRAGARGFDRRWSSNSIVDGRAIHNAGPHTRLSRP